MTQAYRLVRLATVFCLTAALAGCGLFGGLVRPAPAPVATGANPTLFQASLDTLSFLPLQSADPATGQIVYGLGRAPGAGQSYQVTVRIDAATLDARALRVQARTASGASAPTVAAGLTDAILTRARQIHSAALPD